MTPLQALKRVTELLSLLDRSGKSLSLTNLALIVLIARAVTVPMLGIADAVLAVAAFLNYMQKRFESAKHDFTTLKTEAEHIEKLRADLEQKISDVSSEVSKLSSAIVIQRRGQGL